MDNQSSAFLQVEHLSKKVWSGNEHLTILKDINLSVKKSESLAILGASGSGKTTLLSLLAGLDTPTSGNIYLEDMLLNQLDEDGRAQLRSKHIGFIFQTFHLLPSLTALENVMLAREIQYASHHIAKQEAMTWLERVGLSHRLNHYPGTLSGGERQRVAIARAFITQPTLIFADEMTGNLDTHTGEQITDIIFALNHEQQTTLILVTHDARLAERCQRRLWLKEGVLQ